MKACAPIGCDRIYTILGYGQPTFSGIKDMTRLDHLDAYSATARGDGVVTLDMARLAGAVSHFVAEEHAGLTSNHEVLAAIDELLTRGGSERLGGEPGPFEEADPARLLARAHEQEMRRSEELTRQVRLAGGEALSGPTDRQLEESLTRDLLSPRQMVIRRVPAPTILMKHPRVELALANDHVANLDCECYRTSRSNLPVNAIAVGHYLGVKPSGSERELDAAISRAILDLAPEQPIKESDLVLTQYSERGILKGELGQPFFLPDPRDHRGNRIIAIAGMGVPGRFGWPELTVLARAHLVGGAAGQAPPGDRLGGDAILHGSPGRRHQGLDSRSQERHQRGRPERGSPHRAADDLAPRPAADGSRPRRDCQRDSPARRKPPAGNRVRSVRSRAARYLHGERFRARQARAGRRVNQAPPRKNLERDPEPSPTRVTLALEGTSYHFGALTERGLCSRAGRAA